MSKKNAFNEGIGACIGGQGKDRPKPTDSAKSKQPVKKK